MENRPPTDCQPCGAPAHRSAGPGKPMLARAITEGFPLGGDIAGNDGEEGVFKCPSSSLSGLQKGGCSCLKGGGHRRSERGWVACSIAGLIPDALLGSVGSSLCLPACLPGGPGTGGGAGSPGPCLLAPALHPAYTVPQLAPPPHPPEACGEVQLGWLAMSTPSQGQECRSLFLFDS